MAEYFERNGGANIVLVGFASFLEPHLRKRGGGSVGETDIGKVLSLKEVNDVTAPEIIAAFSTYVLDPKVDCVRVAAAAKVPLDFRIAQYATNQTNTGYLEVIIDRMRGFEIRTVHLPRFDDPITHGQAVDILLELVSAKAQLQEIRGNGPGKAQAQRIRTFLEKPHLSADLTRGLVEKDIASGHLSGKIRRQMDFEAIVWKDSGIRALLGLAKEEYPSLERAEAFFHAAVEHFITIGLDRQAIEFEAAKKADGKYELIDKHAAETAKRGAWSLYKGIEWILSQPDVPDEVKQKLITERFVPDVLGAREGFEHINRALRDNAQIALIRSPVLWRGVIGKWATEYAPEIYAQTIEKVISDPDVHNADYKVEFLETMLRDTSWRPPETVLAYLLHLYAHEKSYKNMSERLSRAFTFYIRNRVLEMGDTFEITRALDEIGIFRGKRKETSAQERGEQIIQQITLFTTRYPTDADPKGNWALFAKSWASFALEEYKEYLTNDTLGLLVTAPESVISKKDREKAAFAIVEQFFTWFHVPVSGWNRKRYEAEVVHMADGEWEMFREIIRATADQDARNIIVNGTIRVFLEHLKSLESIVYKPNKKKRPYVKIYPRVEALERYIQILEAVKIGGLSKLSAPTIDEEKKKGDEPKEDTMRYEGGSGF